MSYHEKPLGTPPTFMSDEPSDVEKVKILKAACTLAIACINGCAPRTVHKSVETILRDALDATSTVAKRREKGKRGHR